MRLIDADALIETLENKLPQWGFKPIDRHIVETLVKNEPTINQWIPVSERLPQDEEVVLICHEHIRSIDYVRNGEWQTYKNVDAWMPLPERYKGDDNE